MAAAARGIAPLVDTSSREIPEGPAWTVARQRVMRYLECFGITGSKAEETCDLALRMTAWQAPRIRAGDVAGAAMRTLQRILLEQAEEGANWRLSVWARCNSGANPPPIQAAPEIHRRHMRLERHPPPRSADLPSAGSKKPSLLSRLFRA